MDETQMQCPHCGQAYTLTPEQAPQYLGQTIVCTSCHAPFTVEGTAEQITTRPAEAAPGPQPPLGYYAPVVNPRPTSVTVLAIIGIVLAGLGILCTPIAMIPYLGDPDPGPFQEAFYAPGALRTWGIIELVVGFALAIFLLAACISALKLRPWARGGMLWYSWLVIALSIIGILVVTLSLSMQPRPTDPAEQAAITGGIVGGIIGGVIRVIYPVFVLIFMSRPHVKAAFEAAEAAEA